MGRERYRGGEPDFRRKKPCCGSVATTTPRCAFAVSRDPHAAGAEALFDHALNNGLAVIVSTSWPQAEIEGRPRDGAEPRVKSASALLDVIIDKARSPDSSITPSGADLADGKVRVLSIESTPGADPETVTLTVSNRPEGQPPPHWHLPLGAERHSDDVVRVEVSTLRDAIRIAHPVRHGRARHSELDRRHVDACSRSTAIPTSEVSSMQRSMPTTSATKPRTCGSATTLLDTSRSSASRSPSRSPTRGPSAPDHA